MKIVKLNINDIHPYGANAKLHPERQIAQIKESIKSFGNNDPIAVDENHVIIEGHGRYIALKQMGYEEVDCIILTGMTEEQKNAYRLVHNKLTMNSDFDLDLLTQELENISFDMEQFDFELPDIDEGDIEVTEDEIPMVDEEHEPKTKPGNLYKLGDHYLLCGDSTKKEDVEKLLRGGSNKLVKATLALTDPPYGINIVQNNSIGGAKPATFSGHIDKGVICKENHYMPVKGDDSTDTARLNYELLKTYTNNQIIFGGNYFTDFLSPSPCWLVWDKKTGESTFADVELAWTSFKTHAKLYEWLWAGMSRKGSRQVEGKKRVHPTQKPVGLLAEILEDYSKEKDIILDCFGGSGSTLIACEQLNRVCYMIEYEPYYCDVIVKRWEILTGNKAELIEGEINE